MSLTSVGSAPTPPNIPGYTPDRQLDDGKSMTGHVWAYNQSFELAGKTIDVARAVKVLKPDVVNLNADKNSFGKTFINDFAGEIEALVELSHPNIIGIIGGGETHLGGAKVPFYVMEFVRDAKDIVAYVTKEHRHQRLDSRRLTSLTLQLLEGVAGIHAKGLVHLDLKPANVYVSSEGSVKVGDLGFARSVKSKVSADELVLVKGTRGYLDPALQSHFLAVVPNPPPDMVAGVVSRGVLRTKFDLFTIGITLSQVVEAIISERRPQESLSATCEMLRSFGASLRDGVFCDIPEALQYFRRSFLEQVPLPEARYFPTYVVRVPELANVPLSGRIVQILNTHCSSDCDMSGS